MFSPIEQVLHRRVLSVVHIGSGTPNFDQPRRGESVGRAIVLAPAPTSCNFLSL